MKSTSMLTEMVFILDRSGSMTGLEDDTIGGFNSLIQRQKKEDGDAVVTRHQMSYMTGCHWMKYPA